MVYRTTNFQRLNRDRLRRIAADSSAPARIVVDPAPETIAARGFATRAAANRPDVPDSDFADVVTRFQ